MLIKDSFTLHAPRDDVWALLQEIERVATCVPGVENVTRIDATHFHGDLKVKVGPIAASFNGQLHVTYQTAPEKIVVEVTGEDKASASLVKATFNGKLSVEGDDTTNLDYEMDVALRGRLGSARQLVDSAGAVAYAQTFDFYGNMYASAGTNQSAYGFLSAYNLKQSPLLYLNGRWYDPRTGRFITSQAGAAQPVRAAGRADAVGGRVGVQPEIAQETMGQRPTDDPACRWCCDHHYWMWSYPTAATTLSNATD